MFIEPKVTQKTRAPAERNVVSDDRISNIPLLRSCEKLMEPAVYKHFVPRDWWLWLETSLEKQDSSELLHGAHGVIEPTKHYSGYRAEPKPSLSYELMCDRHSISRVTTSLLASPHLYIHPGHQYI